MTTLIGLAAVRGNLHVRFVLLLVAVFRLSFIAAPIQSAEGQRSVLLLYDDSSSLLGNNVVDRTIRASLAEEFGVELDIRSEYLEASSLREQDFPALRDWLRAKYQGKRFDVIVTVEDSAFLFVSKYYQDLFQGSQIVYWGRQDAIENGETKLRFTGVITPRLASRVVSAVDFIRKLQPDVQQLIVVTGASQIDLDNQAIARQALSSYQSSISTVFLSGLPLETVEQRLASLPGKTAIFLITMNQDGAGRRLLKSDVLRKLSPTAAAPIYTTSAMFVGDGIVGGVVVDQENMAFQAAGLVSRLLHGDRIEELPLLQSLPAPMVDWPVLKRWKLSENRLPPETIVMNRIPSLWDLYRGRVIGVISLCTVETGLVVALLLHRARRKKAERAMRRSERLLQSTIDALDAQVALLDEHGKIVAVNQSWERFAEATGGGKQDDDVNRSYVEVAEPLIGAEEARLVSEAIRQLISGERNDFHHVYPCSRAGEEVWFQVRINRFYTDGIVRLVVAHENVTEIKRAHDAQQHLSGLLLRAQDEERRRIARDLHDVTVQNLATIKADLAGVRKRSRMSTDATEVLGESLMLCDEVISEVRTLSYLLHPPLLDEAGLVTALQWFIRGFSQRSGIQVEILVPQDFGRLSTSVETALFRVVQEGLTNVYRHSGSETARIQLALEEDAVVLRITDTGRGMSKTSAVQETTASPGVGILGMQERLKQIGGRLEIESGPEGTIITARVSTSRGSYAAHSGSG